MGKKLFGKIPVIDYIFIGIGSAIMAIGIGVFLVDAHVVPGGVSGLSMALHYLSNNTLPIGLMIWVLNIPLFLWGLKELGKRFGVRTFYGFTLNSIFIDLFRGEIPGFESLNLAASAPVQDLLKTDFLFFILIGASLLGVGLGLIFKFNGTTAGSDIVAAIMQKKFGMKPGQTIILTDFFVIVSAGIVIGAKDLSPERHALILTLYALFLLFVSSKIIDAIIDGADYARAAYIISDKYNEIGKAIMDEFSRGATALKGRGLYKDIDREVLVTVVTLREIRQLQELIKNIDPDAFVIVNNVHEVMGNGFRRRL